MKQITGAEKVLFGVDNESKENIYISKPTWDCDWYWSFGYLGNKNCHYHLSGYSRGRNINMYEALLADYKLKPAIKENILAFCELSKTIYALKESAELFGRGGMHYTKNPFAADIKNVDFTKHINDVLLPKVIQGLWDLVNEKGIK